VRVTGDVGTAVGVPVANAPVRFRIASSPPFGKLSIDTTASPVLSNGGGLVSARFVAGAATTGTDQIVVCASVDGVATLPPPATASPCNANERAVNLTISQQPLFVKISTDEKIAVVFSNQLYEKVFVVYVTDAAGRGVPNAQVSTRLLPLKYYKGSMAYSMVTPAGWRFVARTQCDNEDKNFNGVLDSVDVDLNMDGRLWPGQSATVSLDNNGLTATGSDAGYVLLRVRHGKSFSFYADYQIEARAATGGSETSTSYVYTLGAAEADVTGTATPGFVVSPFGTAAVCTDKN